MSGQIEPADRGRLPQPVNVILWILVVGSFGSVIVRVLAYCLSRAAADFADGIWWRAALLITVAAFTLACCALAVRVSRRKGNGWWRAIADGTWQAGLIAFATGLVAVFIAYLGT